MRLIWQPRDGEPREFIFRGLDIEGHEAEAIEAVGRIQVAGVVSWHSYTEFGESFMRGSLRAQRAALWALLRRENPDLEFGDVAVRPGELDVLLEDDEVETLRAALAVAEPVDPVQAAYLRSALGEPGDGDPLEPSAPGAAPTAGT